MPTTPQATEVKAEGGHTPGPWIVFGDGDIGELTICPAGRSGEIASILFDDRDETTPSAKRKLADARLIAAAPDMLALLKAMVAKQFDELMCAAQLLIAKAETG